MKNISVFQLIVPNSVYFFYNFRILPIICEVRFTRRFSIYMYLLDCPVSQHMSQHWYTTFNIQQTTQQTTLNATYNIGYIIHSLYFYSSQMCKSCGAIGRASGNRAELSLRREFDPRQIHFFFILFKKGQKNCHYCLLLQHYCDSKW